MMIVKSPLKKQKVRPNRRKASPSSKKKKGKSNGFIPKSSSNSYGRRIKNGKKKKIPLPDIKPWKVILFSIALGALGVLYLGHVFATQELLQEVQHLEQEYNKVKRAHDNYRLTYDRMTGPADIYQKAKEQGFINGGPADKVITIKE